MIQPKKAQQRSFDTNLQRHRAAQQPGKSSEQRLDRGSAKAQLEALAFAPCPGHASTSLPLRVQAGVTATVLAAMCLGAQGAAAAMQAPAPTSSLPRMPHTAPQLAPAVAALVPHTAPSMAPAPALARRAGPQAAVPPPPQSVSLGDLGSDCISLSGGACPQSFFVGGSAAFAQGVNADGRNITWVVASTAPGICLDLANDAARASSRRMTLRLFDLVADNATRVAQPGAYAVELPSVSANFTPIDPVGRLAALDIADFDAACDVSTAAFVVPQNATAGTVGLDTVNATTARLQLAVPHSPDVSTPGSTNLTGTLVAQACPALSEALAAERFNATTLTWEGAPAPEDCIG